VKAEYNYVLSNGHERSTGEAMRWTLVSATNSQEILQNSLLSSPDVATASELMLQRSFNSAATCYNDALRRVKTDLVVFAHQDMYFPKGWIDSLRRALGLLSAIDPNWGVLGVWGDRYSGGSPGYLYWTGVDGTAGEPFDGVREVRTLDEVVLVIRKSSGLWFDERLPGFHMYGTDICLEARRKGKKCYIFSGFSIHNTDVYNMLPWAFWKSCLFIRRKWKSELPIETPCINITWSCWPMIKWIVVRGTNIILRRHKPGKRVANPAAVYHDLVTRGLVIPARSDSAASGEPDSLVSWNRASTENSSLQPS
jgi:Glycosyltransferase like family